MDPTKISTSTKSNLSDAEILSLMVKHSARLLDAGVTTVRDLGSRGNNAIITRERIRRGSIPGPRLQCANAPLTVPGGHCAAMGGTCEGVDGVVAEVRKRAAEGADLLKVMSTGGFMTAGSHPSKARFTLEEMRAIKQEAKKHGMPVTTHATGTEGIDMAADADFDCIEHCAWIHPSGKAIFDPVVAQKLVDKDIAVCPTMNTACIEQCYFCPWDTRDVIVDNLIKMREIGVRIVVGTDAGIGLCLHERYADGLTVMADAGWTPREIAKAATEEAAKVCGLEAETGMLEPGMAADLAAFQGNPVEDVKDYARPKWVMALGRVHKMRPIEPLGDIKAQADVAMKRLREGAGLISA